MNYEQFTEQAIKLRALNAEIENELTENEGEITSDIDAKMEAAEALKGMLTADGADFLGGWLKDTESQIDRIKAEMDYLKKKLEAKQETVDFIKQSAFDALTMAGIEKLKGNLGYSFTPSVSRTTTVNKELLKERYQAVAEALLAANGFPAYVTVTLGAKAAAVPEGEELPDVFDVETKNTCKFLKPRSK